MSQPSNWGMQSAAPASPSAVAGRVNGSFNALLTGHSGPSRPSYAVAGTIWQDTSEAGTITFYFYDGSDDLPIFTLDTSSSEFTFSLGDGTVSRDQLDTEVGAKVDLIAGRNLIINGQGRVNQRGYVSGAATTGANQFTLDRWFVVTLGQNLSFTGDDSRRVMTAPAGGVSQVIEGNAIVGGTYVLNWSGNATATVNGTARTKGETFSLAANTNATVRFSGGSFTDVQLELSSEPTAYERLSYAQELINCQRFAEAIEYAIFSGSVTSGQVYYTYAPFKVRKRAMVDSVVFTSIGATGFNTADPSTGGVSGIDGLRLSKSATSTNSAAFFIFSLFASAELTT